MSFRSQEQKCNIKLANLYNSSLKLKLQSKSQCKELLNDPMKPVCLPIYNNFMKY